MDDAVLMGIVEGVAHLGDQFRRLANRHPTSLQARGQRLALDELFEQLELAEPARAFAAGAAAARPRAGQQLLRNRLLGLLALDGSRAQLGKEQIALSVESVEGLVANAALF